jgi:hypothetical protein
MASFDESQSNKEFVIRPLDKGQDHGVMGEYTLESGEKCEWMVGLDGHGTNRVIDFLRGGSFDWNAAMRLDSPYEEIIKQLDENHANVRQSGTTYAEAKMYSDRVETCTIGDTAIYVYVNDVCVYKNPPHGLENPKEMERLSSRIFTGSLVVSKDRNIPLISGETVLTARDKNMYRFENGDKLNMTQSIGHNSITGFAPEKTVVHFGPEDKVCVIISSDGLTEMLMTSEIDGLHAFSCKEIADMAEKRWTQEWVWKGWDLTNLENSTVTRFDRYDDVLVMKWTNK